MKDENTKICVTGKVAELKACAPIIKPTIYLPYYLPKLLTLYENLFPYFINKILLFI